MREEESWGMNFSSAKKENQKLRKEINNNAGGKSILFHISTIKYNSQSPFFCLPLLLLLVVVAAAVMVFQFTPFLR
ncbi:hypothetical protein I7I50_02098 [Histoplasma capsulatum G186AR]|uniref:Uncharacterized protein n=1 Tax=Ajellomyces capsulatus TaxID=5037 RepID=A0A8H7YFJ6_AJECA|nr:hypothetical protein I7I52_12312 [Histoplasma capsulatum]QSS71308.1 hypothetical protein I7I50_02098 [Histoplasma capsulatum G186AR]